MVSTIGGMKYYSGCMPTMRMFCCLALLSLVGNPLPIASTPASEDASPTPHSQRQRTSDYILGRGHLWLKIDRADFGSDIHDVWGLDTDRYVGLEGCWGGRRNVYFGVEIGRIDIGTALDEDRDRIENFAFTSAEINTKVLFDLTHGLSLGLGAGIGGFWASGEEVDSFGRSDLADLGFGYQGFADINWRAQRFVTGIHLEYQAAVDLIGIDYSNLRLGGHIGVVF